MEHVRTVKEPKQSIPTFAETVALLMQHVKFNVDVKPQNDGLLCNFHSRCLCRW
ncbi:hypothetical protein PLEOSDRAFT_1090027 [Pleurotus ostreatus PC15]|uniref:Uncharacterized protein n=1 Tax=Pleurotus ostreatus (strain PC15) TaxID=1137138 RepID=A0A067NP37_PLEO1|nr:hypothetical protein PLEOSDRAFT_1090027 [Pleurotus ostreatus PC15]